MTNDRAPALRELRPTRAADLDLCLAAEADPEVAPFIAPWRRAEHLAALTDPDQRHLLVVSGGRPVGFVLLGGLSRPDGVIEFRRLVVTARGRGLGRAAVALVVEEAFGRFGADRLWLDVKPDNHRARHVYESAGFTVDSEGDLIVMSRVSGGGGPIGADPAAR